MSEGRAVHRASALSDGVDHLEDRVADDVLVPRDQDDRRRALPRALQVHLAAADVAEAGEVSLRRSACRCRVWCDGVADIVDDPFGSRRSPVLVSTGYPHRPVYLL